MPAGDLNISMTSDEKDLIKGQAKVIKQQDEMIAGYKKMLREAKTAAKQGGTELEKFANKTNKINKLPAQRYREEMDKLNRALKAGLINQTVYNSAVNRLKTAHRGAFNLSGITAFAGKFMGLSAIIGTVTMGLSSMRQEVDRLGEQQNQDAPGMGELVQLAESPEQFNRMLTAAKKSFAEGATTDLGQAAGLQFALESAGIAKYRKDVSQLLQTGVVGEATGLINAAAAMEAALGTDETGGFRAIVSKGFGASKVSPARMEEIVQASARSGSQAKALGLSDEEVLASVAAISKVAGSADLAGTQTESLLKQIEKFGIAGGYLEEGKTLREQVTAIQGLIKGGTDIRDVLGDRQEGIKAFRTLAGEEGSGLYSQAMTNIAEAERTDAFGRKIAISRSSPELEAFATKKRSEAMAELEGSRTATYEQLGDAVAADAVAKARRDHGELYATWVRAGNWWSRRTESSENYVNWNRGRVSGDTRESIERVERAMAGTAEALQSAAEDFRGQVGAQTNAARANQAAAGGATEAR